VWTSSATEPKDRLRAVFQRILSRAPSEPELGLWSRALERQRQMFAADEANAERLLKVGEAVRDTTIPAAEHAALTAVCLSILNLDETLTKE
jgi:hypothetical protein